MAEDSVQPVPCRLRLWMRGALKRRRTPSFVASRSTTVLTVSLVTAA